jgi:hypothetical protein
MPKSRGFTVCECCKAVVPTGTRYDVHLGRPWLPQHLLAYKARRKILTTSSN